MNYIYSICSVSGFLLDLIQAILIAKYVYYEKINRSKKWWIIFFSVYILINILFEILNFEDGQMLAFLGGFYIIIFLSRKKHKIRGLFFIIPITGLVFSFSIVIFLIIMLLTNSSLISCMDNNIYSFIQSAITLVVIMTYVKMQKKWFIKRFGNKNIDIETFELSKIERNIISFNGIILLVMTIFISEIEETTVFNEYKWGIILIIIILGMIILSTVLMMIINARSTEGYRSLSELNKHYLEAQLNHFESYRKSQIETKRIRHDMKNHILCICDLYDNNKFEELGQYIHQLNHNVHSLNKELYIGNDIADAIINEKNDKAKALGFKINIEGSLSGITQIQPIDICTIFANALDNSIDALKYYKGINKVIDIAIRRNKNFLLISFINPLDESRVIFKENKYKTNKKDSENHGFGLENIRLTAEKYKGNFSCSIIDYEDRGKAFAAEVMLKI